MRLSVLAPVTAVVCLAQAPAPRLFVAERHHDFGRIAQNSSATYRFKLENRGDAPLHITGVKATCGCTSTVSGKDLLAPGEDTEIEVTYHSAGTPGPVHKTVEVSSDDPAQAVLALDFDAEVKGAATLSQGRVLFLDLTAKSRARASVKITSETGKPIDISDVDLSPAPWLGVRTRVNDREAWVDLDLLAAKLPPGKLSGVDTIGLHVANPNASVVPLLVQWQRRAPVLAVPAQVAWDDIAGHSMNAELQLHRPDHKPFRILSVRSSNPLVTVAGWDGKAAPLQKLQVLLSAKTPAGEYQETLFLVLDTPGHPEFPVRVSATLKAQ
jgi:hypothetical protein